MLLIGLGHRARQGKNYVANYMKEERNDIRLYAFADELKRYCRDHHDKLLWKWQLAHQTKQVPAWKGDAIYGCTAILQWYGTDVARKSNPDVWVEAASKRITDESPAVAVVTDVRFPNEAAYIKKNGGYVIDVIRRMEDGTQYRDSGRDPNHPSETALDDYEGFDLVIDCKSGDLATLRKLSIGALNVITKHEELLEDPTIYKGIRNGFEVSLDEPFPDAFYDSQSDGFKS